MRMQMFLAGIFNQGLWRATDATARAAPLPIMVSCIANPAAKLNEHRVSTARKQLSWRVFCH
jgi:hypothetical protein